MKPDALVPSRTAALALRERRDALVRVTKQLARDRVPLPIRIERKRLQRLPSWLLERGKMATDMTSPAERRRFVAAVATKVSPMRRGAGYPGPRQRAKEINVTRVAGLLNGVVISPGQVFSYHHVVGRPSILRGFALGPELREGKLSMGAGGGACQVTNMLFQLGLLAGLQVVERHRHGLDLFPDVGRTVPFGCGATVFYNMADLRLRNPHPVDVVFRLTTHNKQLIGALLTPRPLDTAYAVFESDHRFYQRDNVWFRENRIVRRASPRDGGSAYEEEVVHNLATTDYQPSDLARPALTLESDPVHWDATQDALTVR